MLRFDSRRLKSRTSSRAPVDSLTLSSTFARMLRRKPSLWSSNSTIVTTVPNSSATTAARLHRTIFFHFFTCSPFQKLTISECLSQRHKELQCLDSRWRIQQMSYIDADRSHRRLVTSPEPDGMGQVRSHVLETHVGINVSSVIKHYPAQSSANQRRGNAQREAQLGIQDHKLLADHR